MLKYLFMVIGLSLPNISSYSQGLDNLWMMGYASAAGSNYGGTNFDFSSGTPNIYYVYRDQNITTTNANITDSLGQLLFCSNGVYISDASGDTMMNGSGLNPSAYTDTYYSNGLFIPQGDIIVPDPGSTSKYYLFHCTVDEITTGGITLTHKLYYSSIDMTLNNGLGGVTSKNVELLNGDYIPGRLSAVRHGNGRDWWVVFHLYGFSYYAEFLVDTSGVQGPFYIGIGTNHYTATGQTTFSKQGDKFAWYDVNTDLDIFDFDRCTGAFSNLHHIDINDSAQSGGVAFSPSGNFLYVSSGFYVYQYNLLSSNIDSSRVTVAVWDSTYSPNPPFAARFFLAQLAPDNKIYINCPNSTMTMHVINNPDSLGLACDFCQHCISLPTFNAFTLPTPPNYHLGSLQGSICDTLLSIPEANNITFSIFPNPVSDKLNVSFNDNVEILSVKIYSLLGELILQENNIHVLGNAYIANTKKLNQGFYVCQFTLKSGTVSFKFLKE